MKVGREFIERRKVPEFFNEEYWSALIIYNRYKKFGFPYSGGWAEQPAHLIELIEALDDARAAAIEEANGNR